MEPTLMVIGLSSRTAEVAVREHFWISESRRSEALVELARAEGIEEVAILATGNRTEFLLWAGDPTLAANSVLRFLSAEYDLKLCEWKHFYRLLDEEALLHIFRVASGLDSSLIGETKVAAQVRATWQQAQKLGTSGRFLDTVLQKAMAVADKVRQETDLGAAAESVPSAVEETARQVFGSLAGRKVLLLGAGETGELAARCLLDGGAGSVRVINLTLDDAADLASRLGGVAIPFEERWQHMVEADIVISSTSCPHKILTRDEAEIIARERKGRALCLVDIAVPRDIDPAVREVHGVFLCDIDGLEQLVQHHAGEREKAASEAEKIITAEAHDFSSKLAAERVVPTVVALRQRLDEICRQELESFRHEHGPLPQDQNQVLEAVMSRITQRIAGSLARELKELPEKVEQEQLTAALERLFHLKTPQPALAGASS